jgi:hypothetical protein
MVGSSVREQVNASFGLCKAGAHRRNDVRHYILVRPEGLDAFSKHDFYRLAVCHRSGGVLASAAMFSTEAEFPKWLSRLYNTDYKLVPSRIADQNQHLPSL